MRLRCMQDGGKKKNTVEADGTEGGNAGGWGEGAEKPAKCPCEYRLTELCSTKIGSLAGVKHEANLREDGAEAGRKRTGEGGGD